MDQNITTEVVKAMGKAVNAIADPQFVVDVIIRPAVEVLKVALKKK